jgi:hypothetical protein
MYAVTHALMYCYRFNLFPWQLPPQHTVEILRRSETLLFACLDEQDYDLAGILLLRMATVLQVYTLECGCSFAFRCLLPCEDKAGFLPAPRLDCKSLQSLTVPIRERTFMPPHTTRVCNGTALFSTPQSNWQPLKFDSTSVEAG